MIFVYFSLIAFKISVDMRLLGVLCVVLTMVPSVTSMGKNSSSRKKNGLTAAASACNSDQLELVSAIVSEHESLVTIISSFCSVATQPPKEQTVADLGAHRFFTNHFCKISLAAIQHKEELHGINQSRVDVKTEDRSELEVFSDIFEVSSRIFVWIADVQEQVTAIGAAYAALREIKVKLSRFHPMQKRIASLMHDMEHHKSKWSLLTKRVEESHFTILENLKKLEKKKSEATKSTWNAPDVALPATCVAAEGAAESLFVKQKGLIMKIKSDLRALIETVSNFCSSIEAPPNRSFADNVPFLRIKNGFCKIDEWIKDKFNRLSDILDLCKIEPTQESPLIEQIGGLSNELVLWAWHFMKLYSRSVQALESLGKFESTIYWGKISEFLMVYPHMAKNCGMFKILLEDLHSEIYTVWSADESFLRYSKPSSAEKSEIAGATNAEKEEDLNTSLVAGSEIESVQIEEPITEAIQNENTSESYEPSREHLDTIEEASNEIPVGDPVESKVQETTQPVQKSRQWSWSREESSSDEYSEAEEDQTEPVESLSQTQPANISREDSNVEETGWTFRPGRWRWIDDSDSDENAPVAEQEPEALLDDREEVFWNADELFSGRNVRENEWTVVRTRHQRGTKPNTRSSVEAKADSQKRNKVRFSEK